MKLHKLGFVSLVLAGAIVMSACSVGSKKVVINNNVSNNYSVFSIGDKKMSIKEATVYVANFSNFYGNAYGVDLWDIGFKKRELSNYVKDAALQEMTQVVCLNLMAEEAGVVLEDSELDKVDLAAADYYESLSQEEKSYFDVSEEDIINMYSEYVLAKKMYSSLVVGIDSEVSEDEARIMVAKRIFTSDVNKATEVVTKLSNGEDFSSVASAYNTENEMDITFGRGDLPDEVVEAAFDLNEGEYTSCIQTDKGYYFIYCVNRYDEELTAENKEKIIANREQAAFERVYAEYEASKESEIYKENWNAIVVRQDGIDTGDFFSIYSKYFGKDF